MKFNKQYATPEEEAYRREIFSSALDIVNEINRKYEAGEVNYKYAIFSNADEVDTRLGVDMNRTDYSVPT